MHSEAILLGVEDDGSTVTFTGILHSGPDELLANEWFDDMVEWAEED